MVDEKTKEPTFEESVDRLHLGLMAHGIKDEVAYFLADLALRLDRLERFVQPPKD